MMLKLSPQAEKWFSRLPEGCRPSEDELVAVAEFERLIATLRLCKPGGRDEMDRKYAIIITNVETAMAAYMYWLSTRE